MKIKISAAILTLLMLTSLFTACKKQLPAGEEATMGSDENAADILQDFAWFSQQTTSADEAAGEETPDAFRDGLKNPDTDTVSYSGDENITISLSDYCNKTVTVSTTGKLKLNSDISCLVIDAADKGFTAKAKADSLIINGENITADIKNDTGKIYVKGKNAVVNIEKGTIEALVVVNASAIINNKSDETVKVILANGAFISVPPAHRYVLSENLVQEL